MGKCFSCCQSSESVDSDFQLKTYRDHEGLPEAGDNTERHSPSDGHAAMNAVDIQSSGSGQNGTVNIDSSVMPEKRTFYTCIPPLGWTGSGEAKWASLGRDSSEAKTSAFFEMYKDPCEDAILAEGIEHLCADLGVKPEEFKVLVLAWKFGAQQMCRFTRKEFVNGCRALKVESVKGIKLKFPEMLTEVKDPEKFKDLYRYTFKFGLDSESGQRILPADMAICLWKLVFLSGCAHAPPILGRWFRFLEKHPQVRGIPRDTWNMFLNFTEAVGDDLTNYDDSEAWPSLFDDFVEYENDQTNQNITKDSKEESRGDFVEYETDRTIQNVAQDSNKTQDESE